MGAYSSPLFNNPSSGDNQYGSFGTGLPSPTGGSGSTSSAAPDFSLFSNPVNPNQTTPGVVPSTSAANNPVPGAPNYNPGNVSGIQQQANGISTIMPQNPALSNALFNFLQQQIGQGATPFNLSTVLPSSGQATTPGQLNAPLTDVLSQLQNFYSTGTGGPTGSGTLGDLAATGLPTDATPAWQAMIASQGQNTANNAANLREQFAVGGNLASSPFGAAMQQFFNQNTLNQNAQLTQAQQAAQEAAAGRQLSASTTLNSGAESLGNNLQTLDQQSIQNMLAEFIRTQPEYSPYLNMLFGASTTYAPSEGNGVGVGGLGGTLASSGSALSGIADLYSALNPTSTSTNQTQAG